MSAETKMEAIEGKLPMLVLVSAQLGRRALLPLHGFPRVAARLVLEKIVPSHAEVAMDQLYADRLVYLCGAQAYETLMEDGFGPEWRERGRIGDGMIWIAHLP